MKLFGMYLSLNAAVWTGASWFVFTLLYTGREHWVTRRTVAALSVFPIAIAVLSATDSIHGQMVAQPAIEMGTRRVSDFEWSIGPWLIGLHNWTLCALAMWWLFQKFLSSRNVYRKISFFHLVGGLILNVSSFVSLLGRSPLQYLDLGVVLFSAVIVASAPIVVSYRYLKLIPLEQVLSLLGRHWNDLTPMARSVILQQMPNGVLVMDRDNNIVDLNPMGRRVIDAEERRVIGNELTEVVPPDAFDADDASFLSPETVDDEFRGVWATGSDGNRYCFDIVLTPIGSTDDPAGRVALVTDVTERERRKQKLERRTRELEHQNEQLDQFAGIVSHDLRNPLNVARGYLQVAKGVDDEDAIAEAEQSLERMEAIIDDVLVLAREGQSIGETEQVDLEASAREAWAHVETDGAELVVDGSGSFQADPDRLLNLFENLFRNAIEHGGDEVSITVGWEDGRLYVADDGPGIPESEREDVLDFGYTTNEGGTGFGLAIVDQIATAHGWSVTVTESDAGGARFEFEVKATRSPLAVGS
jgi:PAS domain S-box-containing protein